MSDGEHKAGGQSEVPLDRLERNPLITGPGYRNLLRVAQHRDAPVWNYAVGDRIEAEDLAAVERFREQLFGERPEFGATPPPAIIDWVLARRPASKAFFDRVPEGFNLERDWAHVPPMSREDLAASIEDVVPIDADLSRMIVYDTSGTTGHALAIPTHPRAIGMNHPLAEYALARHGAAPEFSPETMACVNVCAQRLTVTFPNVFTVWRQAAFAKVNLQKDRWSKEAAARFLAGLAPEFLTGDPVAFAEMLEWGLDPSPRALISTAVELGAALRDKLAEAFECPVIDWYSTTETGPLAYACPDGHGLHLLPGDVHIEVLDPEGFAARDGEAGEIAVTGGRNPLLPLLRYRTGDRAAIGRGRCSCGETSPRLAGFEGRAGVFFRAADGSVVNPVDVGRALRDHVFVRHRFVQRRDLSCELALRPLPGHPIDLAAVLRGLRSILGKDIEIGARIDPDLGRPGTGAGPGDKLAPYLSEADT